jgi:NAD(P)-dependent dehydrogenase (short-subunit alcohol dehydrogenase family)
VTAIYDDLDGASVFITGGGAGIGAALTEGFLRQGSRVAFVQRSDASAFVDEMTQGTDNAPLFIPCDVSDVAALRAAHAQAAEAHGPVTRLVNNAANDQRHDTLEVDEAFWEWSQAVNLKHYFFSCQAALPGMQAAGGGAIVNVSSISFMVGTTELAVYTAANAGIVGMTHTLAREFGKDRIRINAMAPGWVMTERQKELWVTEEALESHLARQCLPDLLQPADMAGPCLFLASDASRSMTGQTIVADGGVILTR